MRKYLTIGAAAAIMMACASGAQGLVMDWVTVGDPGNADDTHGDGYGGVTETYNIGKYEVTNSQYAEFLNAVAGADPHGLYNTSMASGWGGITRIGSSPTYTYSAIQGRDNMPVNYVSWYDTLRFANWMHNGQGSGDTEDGAYEMSLGASVVRKAGALVFLPSEDEWYKAAYYKGGGTNAGYWDYPTQSNDPPTAEVPSGTDMFNGSANYGAAVGDLTDVGAYTAKPSDSAYGTFDQGGNVWEWNDTVVETTYRGQRGASFVTPDYWEFSAFSQRFHAPPDNEYFDGGFRIAAVPEPGTVIVLAFGSLGILRRKRV